LAALAAVLLSMVGASAALAAPVTKVVYAGTPPVTNQIAAKIVPKTFAKTYQPDINAFFQQRVTVNAGDTVSFRIRGFHTVDLPAKAGRDLPLILPGAMVTGAKDAAGNPFWFNNKVPSLGLNPALFKRSSAKIYNGTQRLDSGLTSAKPFNVTFTKAGTYKFYCDVHPGMVGYVVVKPQGKPIPSAAQDAATLTAQVTTDIKAAKRIATTPLPADTVSLGQSAPGGVELFSMFPATLTVNAGTTVTFQMSKNSREIHTATFGPVAYLTPLAKSFTSPVLSPIATYASDPTQPILESPTAHGNGFANTGVLDADPATVQIPPSSKIDFTKPGVYHFVCLVHPFMHGTIIVK
jgi:plastocyanin